jgi:hypothetical protein
VKDNGPSVAPQLRLQVKAVNAVCSENVTDR